MTLAGEMPPFVIEREGSVLSYAFDAHPESRRTAFVQGQPSPETNDVQSRSGQTPGLVKVHGEPVGELPSCSHLSRTPLPCIRTNGTFADSYKGPAIELSVRGDGVILRLQLGDLSVALRLRIHILKKEKCFLGSSEDDLTPSISRDSSFSARFGVWDVGCEYRGLPRSGSW
ncbi:hypothetical protein VNO77_03176 [Canavalia gladiata]|uniref:Uncharacterized protein n=1 Tax=Canavalia gladiata TaxID=3824 RepID=A0AAN9N0Q4_CANGL